MTIHTSDNYPLAFTAVENLQVISQGSADNFRVKVKVSLTINANGEMTAAVLGFWAECR